MNTNFKNTFFIIAYDKEVVENSLRIKFDLNSKRYLEKIIQVDYKVPEILPEKRHEIFFKELDKFLEEKKIEADVEYLDFLWRLNGFGNYFRSLRDVYRYINALHFRLPSIWRDIDVIDFMLLEAIRIFDYNGYEKLYTFETNRRAINVELSSKEDLDLSDFHPVTEKIVKILLQFERIYLGSRSGDNRFYDSQYRDRYFGLQISNLDVSVEEFEKLLLTNNKHLILQQISKADRMRSFWKHFSNLNKFKEQITIDYNNLFNEIIHFLENEIELKKNADSAFFAITNHIKDSGEYYDLLKIFFQELTKNRNRLSFPCFLFIHWIIDDHEKYKSRENQAYLDFMEKQLPKLEQTRKKYLEEWYSYMVSPTTWYAPNYVAHLFMKHYSENRIDEYKTDLEKLLDDDKAILGITKKLVYGHDDSGKPKRINQDYLKWILPKPFDKTFLNRLKEIFPTLSKNSQSFLEVEFILEEFFPK